MAKRNILGLPHLLPLVRMHVAMQADGVEAMLHEAFVHSLHPTHAYTSATFERMLANVAMKRADVWTLHVGTLLVKMRVFFPTVGTF